MLSYVPVLESDNLIGPIMSFTDRLWNMYAYGIGTAIQWSLISRVSHNTEVHSKALLLDNSGLSQAHFAGFSGRC